jgi:hypothetical protein
MSNQRLERLVTIRVARGYGWIPLKLIVRQQEEIP